MANDVPLPAGFDNLLDRYPWPEKPPVPEAPLVGRDSSGFELLQAALERIGKPNPVIMEVGAEFGGSSRKFLSFPGSFVISVDPWPDSYGAGSFPEVRPFLGGERGMYNLFLTYNFEHRDRLVAVREWSPAGPVAVHDAGVDVDLIYIDGDHRYDPVLRDLTVAGSLFSNAIITGDDWLFDPSHKKYENIKLPVQTAVLRWAAVNDAHVEADGNTWLLDPSRTFNLKRPTPSFGTSTTRGSNARAGEDDTKGRLRSIESALQANAASIADSDLILKKLDDIESVVSKSGAKGLKKRVATIESSLLEMGRLLRQIERSLNNLPSRRVGRKVRGMVKGTE